MEKENAFIDGAISVKAVIENESRPVFGLYISEKKLDDRNIRYIISQAKKKGINPKIVEITVSRIGIIFAFQALK